MVAHHHAEADARLARALEGSGLADPREPLRRRLRELKGTPAYDEAVRHFEERLVPGVAGGELEPLSAWLDFARHVARLAGDGREVAVDRTGRASPHEGDLPSGAMLLHLPRSDADPALPLRVPREPSAAQRAALDLLVEGRLRK